MRITLKEWNNNYFARPRSRRMLYRYIQDGKIFPTPIKNGGSYEVENNAVLLDNKVINNPAALMERINEQTKRSKDKRFTA